MNGRAMRRRLLPRLGFSASALLLAAAVSTAVAVAVAEEDAAAKASAEKMAAAGADFPKAAAVVAKDAGKNEARGERTNRGNCEPDFRQASSPDVAQRKVGRHTVLERFVGRLWNLGRKH